jgi:hypothetical protein
MTQNQVEFVVSGIVRGEELLGQPYLAIIGRCGTIPVRRGDHFRSAVRVDEPEYPHGFEADPVELNRQEIDLAVRGVHSYGEERDQLDRGMTGTLFLTGEGIDRIELGHVLYGFGADRVAAVNVETGAERQ